MSPQQRVVGIEQECPSLLGDEVIAEDRGAPVAQYLASVPGVQVPGLFIAAGKRV